MSGTPSGVVAAEAKKNRANWVVLDKYYLNPYKFNYVCMCVCDYV